MKIKNNNKGAAMIAVLCIMAVFVTLCLSMLLTSSVLMNNAFSRKYEEQCRVSAVTVSKELEYDLCTDSETTGFYEYIDSHIITSGSSSWPYINTDELGHGDRPNAYKEFTINGTDTAKTGDVKVKLYWEWERDGALTDIVLHVDVTASQNNQQHTVKTTYNLTIDSVNEDKWVWDISERT